MVSSSAFVIMYEHHVHVVHYFVSVVNRMVIYQGCSLVF